MPDDDRYEKPELIEGYDEPSDDGLSDEAKARIEEQEQKRPGHDEE